MLQEKIKKLFSTIGASNLEIANYAGCTPSTISRLRSGARTPKPQSPTISTLIFGVIEYSKDNSKTPALLELIGIEDKEMLDTGIRRWLYTDNSIVSNKNDFPNKPLSPIDSAPDSAHPSFSKKLDTIMTLCEMQNVKLAKTYSLDSNK